MSKTFQMSDIDVENFTHEIMALRRAANERMGIDDFKHLKKIERWANFVPPQVMAQHGFSLILFLRC
jgi:hypothetical protein